MNAESTLRLGIFLSILLFMLLWEMLSPRRTPIAILWQRRFNNIALVAINVLILRFAIPVTVVWAALTANQQAWGLLNLIQIPDIPAIILSLLFLDLLIYCQHVVFHKIPVLWRLHRIHHTDIDFDVTTGIRFHPLEIILSMLIKLAGIMLIGAPVAAVIIFEIILNSTSMFNHGNVYIPKTIDRFLRWFIVTPDMHRVHHSVIKSETDSNYGFNVPWWDRTFGTYRAQPQEGHLDMEIGLNEFRGPRSANVMWLLLQPFLGEQRFSEKSN